MSKHEMISTDNVEVKLTIQFSWARQGAVEQTTKIETQILLQHLRGATENIRVCHEEHERNKHTLTSHYANALAQ